MFYVSYLLSELRRRKGRTLLTALGLGVGVALVVTVNALSSGLDRAQDKVLDPLTGVGSDLSVTRPLTTSGTDFRNLSDAERERLREENGQTRVGLSDLGDPGDKFTRTEFRAATQLSFDDDEVAAIKGIAGVQDAAGSLTLSMITVSGTVPKQSELQQGGPPGVAPGAGGGPPHDIDFDSATVTGVDERKPALAAVAAEQVTRGTYFSGRAREVVVNDAFAKRKGYSVGETVKVGARKYTVVGVSKAPLGGTASDLYIPLGELRAMSDRKGRINTVNVRATDGASVSTVAKAIEDSFDGASVTTTAELADKVGGSLKDTKDLTDKLGTALIVVGLAAAFLIASLLTLSSVAKRTRELGTLKALGWPQRLVVRQITGEAVAQGLLGAALGIGIGIGAAAIITAIGPTLEASVAGAAPQGPTGGFGPRMAAAFGQGAVQSGSADVQLTAPVDAVVLLVATGLAVLGGLLSGAVGGLRAARLRPAVALRSVE